MNTYFPTYKYRDVLKHHEKVFREASRTVARKPFNWGGQGNIDLNYNLAQAIDAVKIIETGVAYGWSTLSILLSLNKRQKGSLISVDMPFFGVSNEKDIGCVIPQSLRQRWTLLTYADREGIPKALNRLSSIDFCHYDSDKSYKGKRWVLPVLWDSLRTNGILACDDVSDNLAFKHFCDDSGLSPIIVRTFDTQTEKHVGLAVKPK